MEVYKGIYAQTLQALSRKEREAAMVRILTDSRLNFEEKVSKSPAHRNKTAKILIETHALHPKYEINKILVDWVCQGMAERYVLIAQLALMNSASYEDENP